jgi:hypothetical protein
VHGAEFRAEGRDDLRCLGFLGDAEQLEVVDAVLDVVLVVAEGRSVVR